MTVPVKREVHLLQRLAKYFLSQVIELKLELTDEFLNIFTHCHQKNKRNVFLSNIADVASILAFFG